MANQINMINEYDETTLITKALACLFSLNRRTKHLRYPKNERDREDKDIERKQIYDLKDYLLLLLCQKNHNDISCKYIESYEGCDCDDYYYIIRVNGYCFHSYDTGFLKYCSEEDEDSMPGELRINAKKIPKIGLSSDEQIHCLKRAIHVLNTTSSEPYTIEKYIIDPKDFENKSKKPT